MSGDSDSHRTDEGLATVTQPEADPGKKAAARPQPGARVAGRVEVAKQRFEGSAAGHLWRRLDKMDFINRGMLFAAVLFLCFVPFIIITEALAGQSATSSVIRRFGLDRDATQAVDRVLTSPTATTSAITGLSWVFFVLGGLAAAGAIQELYEAAFEVEGRGIKDMPRRLAWLAAMVGAGALVGWAQPWLHNVGGTALVGLVALVGATLFWWFSMWLLLAGRLAWRELLPAALATGVCWFGMTVVFRVTMSSTITSNYNKYGAIGVVFALMSFLVAIGVVIILGAVFGVVWRERHGLSKT